MAVYLVGDDGDDGDVHVGREVAGDYDHGSLLFVVMTVMLIGGDNDGDGGQVFAGDDDHGALPVGDDDSDSCDNDGDDGPPVGGEDNDGDGGQDVSCEDRDDGPPVGGERAGLVRADRRRVAHRLARVQVPHQVVVAHHFLQNAFVKTVSNFVVAGSRIHQM